jgi:hypothetical protein
VTRPIFSYARWGGATECGQRDVAGWSLYFQLGPIVIELCFGKVK